jgi:hypothetical protein
LRSICVRQYQFSVAVSCFVLFLAGLEQQPVIKKEVMREFSAADEIEELLAEPGNTEPAAKENVGKLRKAALGARPCRRASAAVAFRYRLNGPSAPMPAPRP